MAAPIESDIEIFEYDCNRCDRDDEQDIFDSIIWIACHFSEDVSTYQEYVAMYQEHVWTHLKKLLQRISTVWQVTVRRGDTCIRKVVQFTYK